MRYLFIVLFLTTSVFADSFVVSGGNRSLIRSGRSDVLHSTKPVAVVVPVEVPRHTPITQVPRQVQQQPPVPKRYMLWPGWGNIDLATYDRHCNCGMCRAIRAYQHMYRTQLREYQAWQNQSANTTPQEVDPIKLKASQEPTPDAVIKQTVDLLALNKDDVLADLGCGDGRILIAAVQKYGCKGIGVEIDPEISKQASIKVAEAGMNDRIRIFTGDAVAFDPSSHRVTAITAYLYPELLGKLLPIFQNDKVKVVVSPYHEIPGLAMTQTGDVWVHRRPVAAVVSAKVYTVDGICRLTARNSRNGRTHWSGVVIGPGQILTVAHHNERGPFTAEFITGSGKGYVSVQCELVKSNGSADLSLLKFDPTGAVNPRVYRLKHGRPNRISGFDKGMFPRSFRVFPNDRRFTLDGRDIIEMRGEGVTSPLFGMSGSPVFEGDNVVGIQFGGVGSDIDAVTYKTIQDFLGRPQSASGTKDQDYYVVMFTASYCAPCQAFKKSAEYAKIKERYLVREIEVDTDEDTQWKSKGFSFPTFWLAKRSSQLKAGNHWTGAATVGIVQQAIRELK